MAMNQGCDSRNAFRAEKRPTILVVEDDLTISLLLAYNLERAGYRVRREADGRKGLEAALGGAIDLVLMDLRLPGLDGTAASQEIKRQRPGLPVIMLTVETDREAVLRSFASGADDYVTKPFDMDVLIARIQARLPRFSPMREPRRDKQRSIGDLLLDLDSRTLSSSKGSKRLRPREFGLFELLSSEPGHLFTRREIFEQVWYQRYLPASRSLDVQVRRLRQILAQLSTTAQIETVHGVGYRIVIA